MTETPFSLFAQNGLEPVIDAFKANFSEGLEHGAQFCVYRGDELIIDLHGGWADLKKSREVTGQTLFSVYSSGKAAAALVIAHLVDQDRIGYDQLVSTIWPEFAQNGKTELSIGQVMSHQAGLSGITNPDWSGQDWYDWDKTCAELAAQEPIFEPGSASGYHPVTYGFLAGEIARRADKDMRTLGQILREDLCAPEGIDAWVGLPASQMHRCVDMRKPKRLANLGEINAATRAAFLSPAAGPDSRSIEKWRAAEFAGSNCQATAKAMAQLMQIAVDGRLGTRQILAEDAIEKLRAPRVSGQNLVLPFELTFAAGLMENAPNFFYGPNPKTVGHSGWGGSCVFADPAAGLRGAYVMNLQENTLLGDKRPRRLIDALYNCL